MEILELKTKCATYKCPFCLEEFDKLSSLKKHINKSHLLYGIYCPFCAEIYGTIGQLESHLVMQNDKYHRNLYYLISRRNLRKVNKELLKNYGV